MSAGKPLDAADALSDLDSGWDEAADSGPSVDALDAGWDAEEERAARADVAAGLDAEARRRAAEARAQQRRMKLLAKKAAAKERRKARAESSRQKQKKPKRRAAAAVSRATEASVRTVVREPDPAKSGVVPRRTASAGDSSRRRLVLGIAAIVLAVAAIALFELQRR